MPEFHVWASNSWPAQATTAPAEFADPPPPAPRLRLPGCRSARDLPARPARRPDGRA